MNNIIRVLLIFGPPLISAIAQGARIGIQRVPYIVHGQVLADGIDWRFGAIILNEITVLTVRESCQKQMTEHQMVFGIQSLVQNKNFQRYNIKRYLTNDHLCIIRPTTTLEFSPTIQKAALPPLHAPIPQEGQSVYVAGYGRTIHIDFSDELHYTVAYVGGKLREDAYFSLSADPELRDHFKLDWSEQGSPVWDPRTNVVIGLLARSESAFDYNSPVLILANQRKWIEETVIKLRNP